MDKKEIVIDGEIKVFRKLSSKGNKLIFIHDVDKVGVADALILNEEQAVKLISAVAAMLTKD